jgi:hypothetical protein
MSSTASLRIERDGNSLPLPAKSTGWPENATIGLKHIPFWDNPMIGSVSRADGYPSKMDAEQRQKMHFGFCVS